MNITEHCAAGCRSSGISEALIPLPSFMPRSSLVHSSFFLALLSFFSCTSLLFPTLFLALSSFFPRSFSLFSCSSLRTPCSALRTSYPIRCRSPCFRSFCEEKEQCTCAGKEQWIESKGEMSRQNSTTPICSQYPLYTHCTQQREEQTPPQRDEKWSVLYKKMDCGLLMKTTKVTY